MELKRYQERVLRDIEIFLNQLAEKQVINDGRPSLGAWKETKTLIGRDLADYQERRNGMHQDMPNICIKVPTGGGKTLLASHALGPILFT